MDLRAHGKYSIQITVYLLMKKLLLCCFIIVSKLWPQHQNDEVESQDHTLIDQLIQHHVFMFPDNIMWLILYVKLWIFFFFYHLQVTPEWKILMISQRTQWPSKLIDRRLIKTDHILSLSICQNKFSTCWGNLGLSQLSFVFFKKGYW